MHVLAKRLRYQPRDPVSRSPGDDNTTTAHLTTRTLSALAAVLIAFLMTRRNRQTSLTADDGTTPVSLPAESISAPSTFNDGLPLPKMIIFDLDSTLWPFWVDTHVTGPLKGTKDHGLTVQDSYGGSYGFYNDVAGILAAIKSKGIILGAASRTCAPDLARSMLSTLRIPTQDSEPEKWQRAIDLFDLLEIYPGSKTTHFQKLHKRSGERYEEMLFFDDESRNRNVESLGVVMQLVRDGVTRTEVDDGVRAWRKRNGRMEK